MDKTASTAGSLRWQQWTVSIGNMQTSPNRFDVIEDQFIVVDQGIFHSFYRTLPLSELVSIENVQVFEDDVPLTQNTTEDDGTFKTYRTSNGNYLKIRLFFRTPANEGDARHIRLTYTVNGALRSYVTGDQLIWPALPTHRDYPIDSATVQVIMPPYRPARNVGGFPHTWEVSGDQDTVIWQSPHNLSKLNGFEARIDYDHDPQMPRPPWQGTTMKKPMDSRKRPFPNYVGCLVIIGIVVLCIGWAFGSRFVQGYDTCIAGEGTNFFGCVGGGFYYASYAGAESAGSSYVNSGDGGGSISSSSSSVGSSSDGGSSAGDSGGDGGDGGGDGGGGDGGD